MPAKKGTTIQEKGAKGAKALKKGKGIAYQSAAQDAAAASEQRKRYVAYTRDGYNGYKSRIIEESWSGLGPERARQASSVKKIVDRALDKKKKKR